MRTVGSRTLGYVPSEPEILLSQIFQKKVITVNYNFPGYLYCTATLRDPDSFLKKNNVFYRETTSPGLYAPLQLINIHANSTTQLDVGDNDANKLGSGATALIHVYDNSDGAWASGGNDRDRYVSAIGAAGSGGGAYTRNTISGSFTMTVENTVDCCCAAIDAGVVDFSNYVVVDQEIDFRASAKPAAIGGDFAIDAIYQARLNAQLINGATLWPAGFKAVFAAACQRLILDVVQI